MIPDVPEHRGVPSLPVPVRGVERPPRLMRWRPK